MGASSGIQAGEQASAEALLDAFKTIDDAAKARHAAIVNYWLSIRGSKELPPLRDLDPLEISDAGPNSLLLELVGGGEDANIKYLGHALKTGEEIEQISAAPRQSILATVARKLSIVAISRNFLAFEEEFSNGGATTRCWVTLLPLSSAGAWVDYVYAFVTFDADAEPAAPANAADEPANDLDVLELEAEDEVVAEEPAAEVEQPIEAADEAEEVVAADEEKPVEAAELADEAKSVAPGKKPGFSFDGLAAAGGFYGTQAVKVAAKSAVAAKNEISPPAEEHVVPEPEEDPAAVAQEEAVSEPQEEEIVAEEPAPEPEEEIVAEEPAPEPVAEQEAAAATPEQTQPSSASEGTLQSKLEDVRAKADEARQAKLRANAALYEGLSAAYDFALDAESSPEEYLKMCEEQGIKIQLRSPMKPVAKLAFDGMCDDSTIAQLEAVLAWALKNDLPKGSLAERIEEEGGLAPILSGQVAKAA